MNINKVIGPPCKFKEILKQVSFLFLKRNFVEGDASPRRLYKDRCKNTCFGISRRIVARFNP